MPGTCFRLKEMWYKGAAGCLWWGLAAFGESGWGGTPGSPGLWWGVEAAALLAAEGLAEVEGVSRHPAASHPGNLRTSC